MSRRAVEAEPSADLCKISVVTQQTGLSKELVHHYLRQGLLPKSPARALYSPTQIRLLIQIRVLREDHNLPLETIRRLFALFDFDPGRIETLTVAESLCKRVTRFLTEGVLLCADNISAEELMNAAEISGDVFARYLEAKLIAPIEQNGEERYSIYDASVVALCEHGKALGIPFESIRTIASHVRIAFDLSSDIFYGQVTTDPRSGSAPDGDQLLADFFLRRELAGSLVQVLLQTLEKRHIRDLLEKSAREGMSFDDIVYRPSRPFLRKYDLELVIESAREELRARAEDRTRWQRAAELLIHTSRYSEASFLLDESLEQWPDDATLRGAFGRALLLAGDNSRASAELERALRGEDPDPRTAAFLALALYRRSCTDARPETTVHSFIPIRQCIDKALAGAADRTDPASVEARIYCGWLLTAQPSMFRTQPEGRKLLAGALAAADGIDKASWHPPGTRMRLRITAAFLLWRDLQCRRAEDDLTHDVDELRDVIYQLDPSSAFAETVFLADATDPTELDDGRKP